MPGAPGSRAPDGPPGSPGHGRRQAAAVAAETCGCKERGAGFHADPSASLGLQLAYWPLPEPRWGQYKYCSGRQVHITPLPPSVKHLFVSFLLPEPAQQGAKATPMLPGLIVRLSGQSGCPPGLPSVETAGSLSTQPTGKTSLNSLL